MSLIFLNDYLLVIALCKAMMTFLAVVSSQLPPSDVVCPVFFIKSATFLKFHSGVTQWMVSPGAICPPLPFSDATVVHWKQSPWLGGSSNIKIDNSSSSSSIGRVAKQM